jgi:hypothetical protein
MERALIDSLANCRHLTDSTVYWVSKLVDVLTFVSMHKGTKEWQL